MQGEVGWGRPGRGRHARVSLGCRGPHPRFGGSRVQLSGEGHGLGPRTVVMAAWDAAWGTWVARQVRESGGGGERQRPGGALSSDTGVSAPGPPGRPLPSPRRAPTGRESPTPAVGRLARRRVGASILQGGAGSAPPEGPQRAWQNLLVPDPQGSPSPRAPAARIHVGSSWELGGELERSPQRARSLRPAQGARASAAALAGAGASGRKCTQITFLEENQGEAHVILLRHEGFSSLVLINKSPVSHSSKAITHGS